MSLTHGKIQKETDTETEKFIYYKYYTPGWFVWGECLCYEVNDPLLQVYYKP